MVYMYLLMSFTLLIQAAWAQKVFTDLSLLGILASPSMLRLVAMQRGSPRAVEVGRDLVAAKDKSERHFWCYVLLSLL